MRRLFHSGREPFWITLEQIDYAIVGVKKPVTSGDRIACKNNAYAFFCDPEECVVASVNQIGPKLIGSLDLLTYPIERRTDAAEVVAEDDVCVASR